jgi:hypothetical protein
MEKIIIAILVILLLLSCYSYISHPTEIKNLQPILNHVIQESGYPSIPYSIYESNLTYTVNKNKIYMKTKGYNPHTILFVALHEIAHIICDEKHHTTKFKEIEKRLHLKAIELGFIQRDQIENNYPCIR